MDFISTWLELKYRHTTYPGFNVCISHNGNIVREFSFGYADSEQRIPLRSDHIFRIGSLSKTYTALASMQLHEEQRLNINHPVVEYLPWIGLHKDQRWKSITIRELLSHTAGLCANGPDSDFWNLTRDFPNDETLPEIVSESALLPGGRQTTSYSNLAYAILGLVISSVSKISYEQYMARKIIEPMRLSNTSSDFSEDISERLVDGHTREGKNRCRQTIPANVRTYAMSAAGGFCATAADVCRFYNSFLPGQICLVSEESKRDMHTRAIPKYYGKGLGFDIIYHPTNSFLLAPACGPFEV